MPGFFEYLADERGLRPESIVSYRHHLACFEAYLDRIGVTRLRDLSPAILSAFVAERAGAGLAKTTVRSGCGVLRVFLRYAHRQGLLAADLSKAVEWPTAYQLSGIPRSISWAEVGRVLGAVDRRTPCGKRDYAILLLLVTYGLRAREVAALTLDDIDWRRDRLAIPGRKAGHSTAFPLSAVVGEALVDYLRHGRPPSSDRHVFFRALAPGAAHQPGRGLRVRPALPAQGRDPGAPPGVAHAAAYLRPAAGGRRFRVQGDRGLHRAPLAGLHSDLRQGGHRAAAPGRARRRGAGAGMTETIACAVERFIAHKRAHGRKYHSEARELALLVRFAAEHQVSCLGELTPALLEDFLASRPRPHPRSFNHLLGVVRCLLDWAVTWGLLEASPLQARRHRVTEQRIPFLFDPAQARRLLDAAAALPDGPRAPAPGPDLPCHLRLVLRARAARRRGLRPAPGRRRRRPLAADRARRQVRQAPPGPARAAHRRAGQPSRPPAAPAPERRTPRRRCSPSTGDDPVHPGTASQAFHHLVAALELPVPDGVSPPRLHDLRHSFAVGCLLRWYRDGLDPSARLCQLSTFMGHVEPRSTSVYLTMTPHLLAEASRRFEAFAAPAWTQAAR